MTRIVLGGFLLAGLFTAKPTGLFARQPANAFQNAAPSPPAAKQAAAAKEQEPPEEDESLIPKEYTLNPLEAERNVTAGNFYYRKGNYRAAARRYLEATRWDPGSSEGFLKLGEASEKVKDLAAARDAYTKYLAIVPDAKNAQALRKKMEKWPSDSPKR